MPAIRKQRRGVRTKAFRKRRDRFGGSSKPKPFTPLTGKLKSNNNLLAKALTTQKQETQLLFAEKVELTSQLQALTMACNKRDLVFTKIQNNAKEMLAMLVTMTNYVTNTIMCCQEFSHKSDSNTPRPSSASAMRRESARRLSTKSPARGVVKPMVSGHMITKPTINLRRVNMQRANNLMDLSIIDESSPTNSPAFTSTNRLGYEGERKRRMPERIPVQYVEDDDDEAQTLDTEEIRLSARFSERLSNSFIRNRNGNTLMGQMRSPSVSLCDVSKLLQNSQTINVRMLKDSQGNEDLNAQSDTVQNSSQSIGDGNTSSVNTIVQQSKSSRRSLDTTLQSSSALRQIPLIRSIKTIKRANNTEIDPLEGPSWLLNKSVVHTSHQNTEESTVEIIRRKHIVKSLDSSKSDVEPEINPHDESMEFTECINPNRRPPDILIPKLVDKQTNDDSHLPNLTNRNEVNAITYSEERDLNNLSNYLEDVDEECTDLAINHSSEFVTDRRQRYAKPIDDDDDDDTIMLQFSKGAKKSSKFNINDFRLPVVSCPIVALTELNDSEPEVTTTIQRIPQTYVPPNLLDESAEDRVENVPSFQLPKIDDELTKNQKAKRTVKRKQTKKNVTFHNTDSSDSDFVSEPKKKTTKSAKTTNLSDLKDPSSAKVVLQKLNDVYMKIRFTSPDQNLVEKTQDPDASNHGIFETRNSELINDSSSSTHSVNESNRPRRKKAPTNLKEPSLSKKLRR